MDIIDFANIPCIACALEHLRNSGISSVDAWQSSDFQDVRLMAKSNVLEALKSGQIRCQLYTPLKAERELLAYPVARMIVSHINSNYLTGRYSLAMAKRAYEYISGLKEPLRLKEIAGTLGIDAAIDDATNVTMHFIYFIKYSHLIHDPDWKLLNRTVRQGMMIISRRDLARLLSEAVRLKIRSGLPHEVPRDIKAAIDSNITEIRETLDKCSFHNFDMKGLCRVIPACFPPCISSAIADVKAGVNLSHTMRFAMTSFLLNIGMEPEKITEIFRSSPDFREQDTSYQISHIGGASGTIYTCPSCATMATNGNCAGKATGCKKIEHPLVYYRRKVWLENQEPGKIEPRKGGSPGGG